MKKKDCNVILKEVKRIIKEAEEIPLASRGAQFESVLQKLKDVLS